MNRVILDVREELHQILLDMLEETTASASICREEEG